MNTHFPIAPDRWSNTFGNQLLSQLARYFSQLTAKDEETPRVILRSASGTLYQVNVSDIGRLYTSPVDDPASPIVLEILFSARMTSGLAIPAAAGAPTYQAPINNVGGYFASGRFAPPSGVYQVSASVGAITTGNNAEIYVALYLNGAEIARGGSSASQTGVSVSANVVGSVHLTLGDYVEARIWGDRVGSTDTTSCGFSAQGQVTQ